MEKILIVTDSCSELSPDLLKKYNILYNPLYFTIDEKTYPNKLINPVLSNKEFYSLLREQKQSHTSQVVQLEVMESIKPYIIQGYKIIILSFSSSLSGTYSYSYIAAEMLKEEFKDLEIEVIDSLCASVGQAYFVLQVAKYLENGHSFLETCMFAKDLIFHVNHLFIVEDISILERGGRLSATSAFVLKL